ncbi:MAG: hypothetical protein ACC662_04075 [Planctomycetota bacterium]
MGHRTTLLAVLLAATLAAALSPGSARAEEAWGFDPRVRSLPADEVLVAGPAALRRRDVDAYVDLVEAAFDLSIPRRAGNALRNALEGAYTQGGPAWRKAYLALVAPLPDLRRLAREDNRRAVEEGLSTFRRALDARLEADPPAKPDRILHEVLAARERVAWAGRPPISATSATAWMELVVFVASAGRNEAVRPTDGQWGTVRDRLGPVLARQGEASRRRLLRAHRTWLGLRARWDAVTEGKRLALRFAVLDLMVRALPKDRRFPLGEGRTLKDYARAAAVLRGAQSAYDAWSNLARNPDAVLDVLERWLPPAPAGRLGILLAH